jgi:hypothetical protein
LIYLFLVAFFLTWISLFISYLFVFTILLIGISLIIFGQLALISVLYQSRKTSYKRILVPVTHRVIYVHRGDEPYLKRTNRHLSSISLVSLVLIILFFAHTVIIVSDFENYLLNISIALYGLISLVLCFYAYRGVKANQIISKEVDYYTARLDLKFPSMYLLFCINSISLVLFSLLVAIRKDVFQINPILIITGGLGLMSCVFSLGLYVLFNSFIQGFSLHARTDEDELVKI